MLQLLISITEASCEELASLVMEESLRLELVIQSRCLTWDEKALGRLSIS